MKTHRLILAALLCGSCWAGYGRPQDVNPDNTKVNRNDRKAGEPTADQQKINRTDRDLTKKIRQSIMSDKSLSTYAHNVKVISQGGMVTLKGPVHSEEEKKSIESKAVAIAGSADKVNDQITVKP